MFAEFCDVVPCSQATEIEPVIQRGEFDGICFDLDFPDQDGLDALRRTKAQFPAFPIIMLTTQHSESLAIWAFRAGVIDYLVKPVSRTDLHRSLRILSKAVESQRQQQARSPLKIPIPIPAEIPFSVQQSDVKLLPAIYYVRRNYRFKIKSEVVADLCGMSPFRFSRSFHETYSITFQDFVIRQRVLEACRLLKNPNMNITDVAYAVGFNDASYFSRTFRRCIGVAPSVYCSQYQDGTDWNFDAEMLRARLKLPHELAMDRHA
ncbi:MAG: response regulator transcription factor [Gammaproteobacteria bacterium]|nr:response regulator transcription factor [Gammaproteobacteria bacterium]